ncbi:MAG: helix-turn-helix domain-containing protein [Muribaculaceae bacterium]
MTAISSEEPIRDTLSRIEQYALLAAKEALNTNEAALLLGVSPARVRAMACRHEIPYYKKGGKVWYSKGELTRCMLDRRIPTDDELQCAAANSALMQRVSRTMKPKRP